MERRTNAVVAQDLVVLVGEGAIEAHFYLDDKQRLADDRPTAVSIYL